MVKIPLNVFPHFPPEPENRVRLLINALRHDPVQVIMAWYLDKSISPHGIQRLLREQFDVTVNDIATYFDDVLVPSHQVRGPGPVYEPTHWVKYGISGAQFTMRYCIDKNFGLGDIFGRVIVRDQPTTFRRYKLLKTLYERKDTQSNVATLARDSFSHAQTISSDVAHLEDLGLLVGTLQDVDKFVSTKYRWDSGTPTQIEGSNPIYVFDVARAIYKKGVKTPGELIAATSHNSNRVFSALRILNDAGFVQTTETKHIFHEWDIRISPKGKQLWEEYFLKLLGFCSGKEKLPRFESEKEARPYLKATLDAYAAKR